MSAFLAPIHFWLYHKVELQEELIQKIAGAAEEKAGSAGGGNYQRYVRKDLRPLDEMIDTMNIHGWLNERIQDAETRYAALVTEILKADEQQADALETLAFQFGQEHRVPEGTNAAGAYRAFEDALLNGMPCDRVNVLTQKEADHVVWEQTADLHGRFWEEAGSSAALYYRLRSQVMRGMLAGTGLKLNQMDRSHYEIRSGGGEG